MAAAVHGKPAAPNRLYDAAGRLRTALISLALRNLESRERPLVRRQQAHLDGFLLDTFWPIEVSKA
jgi:hypothetical protein